MGWSQALLLAALEQAGLGEYAPTVLGLAAPSIHLVHTAEQIPAPRASFRTPYEVDGAEDVVAVASSGHHVLALRADGTVLAWGENRRGQLGDGTRVDRHRRC